MGTKRQARTTSRAEIVETGRFSLPDFGAFAVRETPRRTALNPRTGEKVPPPHPYVSELDPMLFI